jgi:hypothetical protein
MPERWVDEPSISLPSLEMKMRTTHEVREVADA